MKKTYLGKSGLSICWMCAKSCGGCSWSREFIPINGWRAVKKTRNKYAYGKILNSISFTVKKCPEFEIEIFPVKYEIFDEGMELLARKVLIETGRDYKNACEDLREMRSLSRDLQHSEAINEKEHTLKSIDRFLTDDNIYADILNLDGESLASNLRRGK